MVERYDVLPETMKAVKIIRGVASNDNRMYICVAEDGKTKARAFSNTKPDRDSEKFFQIAGYDEILEMENGDVMEWYSHPITVEFTRNGDFRNVSGIVRIPDGARPDSSANLKRMQLVMQARALLSGTVPLRIWDCETTGLDKVNDDIVSVACVDHTGMPTTPEENVFMRPLESNRENLKQASRIHGLTWDDLKGYPTFCGVHDVLKESLHNTVWAVYNDSFDPPMLMHNCLRHGCDYIAPASVIDVMQLGMEFTGATKRVKLEVMANTLGVEVKDAHNAYGDVLMTYKILDAIANSPI